MPPITTIGTINRGSTSLALDDALPNRLFQITKAYVTFLQALFTNRPVGSYRWLPNPVETELMITGQSPVTISEGHINPIISVVRTPVSAAGLSRDNSIERNLFSQNRTLEDLVTGTMMINCIAPESQEAEHIAYICKIGLLAFSKVIIRAGRLNTQDQKITIGAPTAPGQLLQGATAGGWRLVQVSAGFSFIDQIRVTMSTDVEKAFYVKMGEFGFKFDEE